MSTHDKSDEQEQYAVISDEEARELIEAVHYEARESIIAVLLPLYDSAEGRIKDSIYQLIKAAHTDTFAHERAIDKYLAALREGKKPHDYSHEESNTAEQEESSKSRELTELMVEIFMESREAYASGDDARVEELISRGKEFLNALLSQKQEGGNQHAKDNPPSE
jgi:hypothetical protein